MKQQYTPWYLRKPVLDALFLIFEPEDIPAIVDALESLKLDSRLRSNDHREK
jgi:hypothetical protein